jgi:hypothetical protein
MNHRDRERAEAIERVMVCLFILIIFALSSGAFGD